MSGCIIRNPIAWYYVMVFLRSCDFLGAVLIPFFTDWGHLSQGTIQLLESWFFLWATVLEIPTGVIADRMPRKYAVAGGLFFSAGGFFLYGMVAWLPSFMLAEILVAIGMAFISGAEEAWLYGTLTKLRRQHEMSAITSRAAAIASFSRVCTAPIGTLIALYWGLNAPVLCYTIPVCCAMCIMIMLPEPHYMKRKRTTMSGAALKGFSFVWSNRSLRSLTINISLVVVAGYFVIWLYQPLLRQLSIPITYFGITHMALSGAQLIVAWSFPTFARLFRSQERFIRYMALITAVAFVAPVCYPHLLTALFFVVVGGGFGLTRRHAMSGYVNDHIPVEEEEQRATILSAISFVQRLFIMLCNPLIGTLATISLRMALGLLAILPFMAFFFFPDRDKRRAK